MGRASEHPASTPLACRLFAQSEALPRQETAVRLPICVTFADRLIQPSRPAPRRAMPGLVVTSPLRLSADRRAVLSTNRYVICIHATGIAASQFSSPCHIAGHLQPCRNLVEWAIQVCVRPISWHIRRKRRQPHHRCTTYERLFATDLAISPDRKPFSSSPNPPLFQKGYKRPPHGLPFF